MRILSFICAGGSFSKIKIFAFQVVSIIKMFGTDFQRKVRAEVFLPGLRRFAKPARICRGNFPEKA